MLVTVAGPRGRRDLSLPADVPVAELLPVLVRLVGDQLPAAARWTLAPAGGQPLAEGSSLAAAGVLHGALLRLDAPPPPRHTPAAPPSPPPLPSDGRTPSERTAAALPPRHPLAERATLIARVLAGDRHRAAPAPPGAIAFTPGQPPEAGRVGGPLDRLRRARETWRSTSYLESLDAAVQRPRLARPATVAVAAAQEGAGASTVTGLLGTLLALLREDRVVAVDAGEGTGSLWRTLGVEQEVPAGDPSEGAGDLLARLARAMPAKAGLDRPRPGSGPADDLVAGLAGAMPAAAGPDARLGRAVHGLAVLPAPVRRAPLDQGSWQVAIDRLSSLYPVVLLDCGAGLASRHGQALVRACEQLVLVTDADPAGASLAVEAALPLTRAGLPVTMVVNRMPAGGGRLDLDRLGRYLPDARGLVAIPDAPAAADELATGAFTWHHAPAGWRRALRELAASLVADWPRLALAR
jgi:MinD-like ATPase involved in chromosome partitioning or flagellar assembly